MTYGALGLLGYAAIVISDLLARINTFIGVSNGSTLIIAASNTLSTLVLFKIAAMKKENWPNPARIVMLLWIATCACSLVRGMANAEDYWDWKQLLGEYAFSALVVLAALSVNGRDYFGFFTTRLAYSIVVIALLVLPLSAFVDSELYPRAAVAIPLLLLALPRLPIRLRWVLFWAAVASVSMSFGYRVNLVRIGISLAILLLYWFGLIRIRSLNNTLVIAAFIFPPLLLGLGVSNQFNVFQDGLAAIEALDIRVDDKSSGDAETSNLNDDTRTLIYREVFDSMYYKGSSYLFGEGGGSSYYSQLFLSGDLNGKGRYGSEVGFLNLLLYSGAVGVVIFGAVLAVATYYAVNRCRNTLGAMLGLWLASRWIMFFVEDSLRFDLNSYLLWLVVGLCFSRWFRAMTDTDIQEALVAGARWSKRPLS